MDTSETILAICMGIALSAACGFRVFVPLLAAGLATRFGGLHVADSLAWTGSTAALICLGVATIVEIVAYYIPCVDHVLDWVNAPLALIAGGLIMSGALVDLPPYLQWGLGVVGGAGCAGVVKVGTGVVRGLWATVTVGFGNWITATCENVLAVVGAVLAVVAPYIAAAFALIMFYLGYRVVKRLRAKKAETAEA